MAFRTTRAADEDIFNLYEHGVLEYGQPSAESYVAALRAIFELLAANPFMARERSEARPPVRLYPYRAHHILYRIDNEDVLILRVLHGRQDWIRHL
jgi:toxin ParE1/3/4